MKWCRNLFLLLVMLLIGCAKNSDEIPIYPAANGVMIKYDEFAMVGDTFQVRGTIYTIIDKTMHREMVDNGAKRLVNYQQFY